MHLLSSIRPVPRNDITCCVLAQTQGSARACGLLAALMEAPAWVPSNSADSHLAVCLQLPTTSSALGQAPQQLPPGSAAGGGGSAAGLQGHLGAAFSSEAQRQQQGSPASFPPALGRGGAALGRAAAPQAYADIFRAKGQAQLSSSAPHTVSQPRAGAGHGASSGDGCQALRRGKGLGPGHNITTSPLEGTQP